MSGVEKITNDGTNSIDPTSPLYLGFIASHIFSSISSSDSTKGISTEDMGIPKLNSQQVSEPLTPQQMNQVVNLIEAKIVTQIAAAWNANVVQVDQASQQDYQHRIQEGLNDYSALAAQMMQRAFDIENAAVVSNSMAVPTGAVAGAGGTEFVAQSNTTVPGTTVAPSPVVVQAQPSSNSMAVPNLSMPVLQPPAIPDVNSAEGKGPESTGFTIQILSVSGLLMSQMSLLTTVAQTGAISHLEIPISVPGMDLVGDLSLQAVQSQVVPVDISGAVAMMAALFGTTIVLTSTLGALGRNKKQGSPNYNKQFAENHIQQTLTLIGSPYFEKFVKDVIIASIEDTRGPLSQESQNEIIASLKLVYLLSSLAVYYKAETGKITPEEIQGLLNGTIKLPKGDPRIAVIEQIDLMRAQLKGEAALRFWTGVMDYFAGDPATKDLLEPANMLHALSESGGWFPQFSGAAA